MNRLRLRRLGIAILIGLFAALFSGCVPYLGVGYDGDYYQPYGVGVDYVGWGPGYRVGPGRGGERRDDRGEHVHRSAPAARPVPSVPSRSRGGSRPH